MDLNYDAVQGETLILPNYYKHIEYIMNTLMGINTNNNKQFNQIIKENNNRKKLLNEIKEIWDDNKKIDDIFVCILKMATNINSGLIPTCNIWEYGKMTFLTKINKKFYDVNMVFKNNKWFYNITIHHTLKKSTNDIKKIVNDINNINNNIDNIKKKFRENILKYN